MSLAFRARYIITLFLIVSSLSYTKNSHSQNISNHAIEELTTVSISYDKPLNDEDLVILQVNLGKKFILSDSLTGYKNENDSVFVPLAEIAAILEFPINISEDGTKAEGWFISNRRKFFLDTEKDYSIADGKVTRIDPRHIRIYDGDIYVDIKMIKTWFSFSVTSFNKLSQTIEIESTYPLPLEDKIEREAKQAEINKLLGRDDGTENMRTITTKYKLASIPFVDLRYQQDYSKSRNGSEDTNSSLNALMVGDLLYLNHRLFTSVSKGQGFTNVRLTSGKKDQDAQLLGPLKATKFEFGDVYTPRSALTARSQSGKGFMFSNYPENYISEFDTVPIRGNMQPGWEVELYRNNSLINFTTVSENGIYEFLDVPLISGLNIIKLVFHGPFGQKREESRNFLMSNELVKKNKFYYKFATNKHNEDFIEVNKSQTKLLAKDNKDGNDRYFAEAEYGIAKTTSILSNISKIPIDSTGEQRNYGTLGIKSSLFGVYGRFDTIKDLSENHLANQLSLQTKIKEYSFTGKFDRYDEDFISEEHVKLSDPIMNRITTRINGPVELPFLPKLRLSLNGTREYFKSRDERINSDLSISFNANKKLNITNTVEYNFDRRITTADQRNVTRGTTLLSYRFSNDLSFRGNVSYDIQPTEELTSSSVTADYILPNQWSTSFSVNHQFGLNGQDSSTSYGSNLNKSFEKYIISLTGNYSDNKSYSMGMNMSLSFGYDPRYNTSTISSRSLSSSGALSAKVFLDENGDGEHNKEEELLQNVSFKVDGRSYHQSTNEHGVALIGEIPPNRPVKIEIDTKGLDNPYWIPKNKAIKLITHPGNVSNIDFPILPTGEAEGTVLINQEGRISEASNVELELIDNLGRIVKTSKSSFDGFYLLDFVPFGEYKLRVSRNQLIRLGLVSNVDYYDIKIDNDNLIVSGFEFIVSEGIITGPDRLVTEKIIETKSGNILSRQLEKLKVIKDIIVEKSLTIIDVTKPQEANQADLDDIIIKKDLPVIEVEQHIIEDQEPIKDRNIIEEKELEIISGKKDKTSIGQRIRKIFSKKSKVDKSNIIHTESENIIEKDLPVMEIKIIKLPALDKKKVIKSGNSRKKGTSKNKKSVRGKDLSAIDVKRIELPELEKKQKDATPAPPPTNDLIEIKELPEIEKIEMPKMDNNQVVGDKLNQILKKKMTIKNIPIIEKTIKEIKLPELKKEKVISKKPTKTQKLFKRKIKERNLKQLNKKNTIKERKKFRDKIIQYDINIL